MVCLADSFLLNNLYWFIIEKQMKQTMWNDAEKKNIQNKAIQKKN